MHMFLKVIGFSLLVVLSVQAQKQDLGDEAMKSVVPENRIPPSPVLTVDEALKSFQIAPGFVIEPVAAEPLVQEPVCLDFDPAGRMWVCEMTGFMPDVNGKGEANPQGRIVILEDTNHDGKADKRTVFLDQLMLPRAVCVFNDGILFIDETRICWQKRDGDQPLGPPTVINSKLMEGSNVEHKPNGLLPDIDNRYYMAKSASRLHRVGDDWQLEPTSFRGQWGIARDDWGKLYHNNNSTLLFGDLLVPNLLLGNPEVKMKITDFVQLGDNRLWPARVNPGVNRAYMAKANGFPQNVLDPKTFKLLKPTSAAGMTIYRGTNFPRDWYGTAFTTEPTSNLVKATRILEKSGGLSGSYPTGETEFLASTDERFRPVNAYTAPDGSLYIVDMYHGIIQHKTYLTGYLKKQSLSRGLDQPPSGLGRIYRIRATHGKIIRVQDLSKLHGLDLVKMLMHPNAWQRETAQRLLVEEKDAATIPYLEKLAATGSPLAKSHAFWTLEGMGALKPEDLLTSLENKEAKLQSSALWASTRLSSTEFEKLSPLLLNFVPDGPEVLPYLARALGPLGRPEAFAKLAELLAKNSKVPFVRQATVSGLAHHETAFLAVEGKSLNDPVLQEWLEQGAKGMNEKKTKAPALIGENLASFGRGKALFHGEAACFGCHSADGAGVPNLGPPLDNSEWVNGKPEILVQILLHGLNGPITVAGETYKPDAEMPALSLNLAMTDQHLADIATYIRNEWSNHSSAVSPSLIGKQRAATQSRRGRAWTAEELLK